MSARLRPAEIGRSQLGRPLEAALLGADDAPVRVLVVAGQHGDEPVAVAAARALVRTLTEGFVPPRLAVAVVPCLNPDGAEARRRPAADGTDLNRDHLLLATPEARALHAFARAFRPTLVVDVHAFPARRRALLAHGLVHAADVLVDTPTHPALHADGDGGLALRAAVAGAAEAAGFRAGRYALLTDSGRLRHSTPDGVDLRTALALRLGVPTLLVEGRAPARRVPGAVAERTVPALVAALEGALRAALAGLPALPPLAPGAAVAVRTRYARGAGRPQLPMLDARTGAVGLRPLPGRYRVPAAAGCVALPAAYAVCRRAAAVLDVLARHGLHPLADAGPFGGAAAEALVVAAAAPSARADRPPRDLALAAEPAEVPADAALFPTDGPAGRALALWLEPHAKHGLARLLPDALPLTPGARYPVLRVYPAPPCR